MDLHPLRVLLVEDDENLVEMVQIAFEGEGFQLETAQNGREGFEKGLSLRPDLILMDVAMPAMDGYEATRRLRHQAETKDIPIFFLTAKVMENDIQQGKLSGADLYLVKPFSPFELIRVIHDFFRKRTQFSSGQPCNPG